MNSHNLFGWKFKLLDGLGAIKEPELGVQGVVCTTYILLPVVTKWVRHTYIHNTHMLCILV